MGMRLKIPLLDEPLLIEKDTILVVEDIIVFATMVKNLYQLDDQITLKIFDSKFKELKSSDLLIITDILGFDVNTAAILKLIYADLIAQLNDKPEVKTQIEQLADQITGLISYECLENELDLEYDEITLMELIKALGIRIETQSDTIFEKMTEIMQVYDYLKKKRLLVFVNVLSYFTLEEIRQIREYIQLAQIDVLFLEPRRQECGMQYVLDEDFVLL